jgi:hypothetical protein
MTIDFKNKMILIQAQTSPLKTSCGAQDCPAESLDAAQGSGGAAEHCWMKTGTRLALDIKRLAASPLPATAALELGCPHKMRANFSAPPTRGRKTITGHQDLTETSRGTYAGKAMATS